MVERDDYTKEIVEVLQQDWKTGLSLFEELLRNPGDVEARKKLRELERKHRERKRVVLKIPFTQKHDHSILDCEMHLLHDPWDVECLFKLAELLRHERDAARWVYEDIEDLIHQKADEKTWDHLAEGYESVEAWGKAAAVYRMLNNRWPHPRYESKIVGAESRATHKVGATGSFRDHIRDRDEARKLEEAGRLPKSGGDYARRAQEQERELEAAITPEKKVHILVEIARDYLRAEDTQRAREHYAKILEIDPDNRDAIEALTRMDMAAATDRRNAIEIGIAGYEKLSKLEPTNAEYNLELGRLHYEAADLHKAILEFQKAGRHPNFKRRARSDLAKCFYRQGLYSVAAKEYEEILADSGIDEAERMEASYDLADCYYRMGELKRAFDLFAEVYRRRADFKDVMKRLFDLKEELPRGANPAEK